MQNKVCNCGGEYHLYEDAYNRICLTDPPLYIIQCKKCGKLSYVFWHEYVFYLNEFNNSRIAENLTHNEKPTDNFDCKAKPLYSTTGNVSFPPEWGHAG